MQVCGIKTSSVNVLGLPVPVPSEPHQWFTYAMAFLAIGGMLFSTLMFYKKRRAEQHRLRLRGDEVSSQVVQQRQVYPDYGSVVRPDAPDAIAYTRSRDSERDQRQGSFDEPTFVAEEYYPEQPRWIL